MCKLYSILHPCNGRSFYILTLIEKPWYDTGVIKWMKTDMYHDVKILQK
jgi:hypothetical protein